MNHLTTETCSFGIWNKKFQRCFTEKEHIHHLIARIEYHKSWGKTLERGIAPLENIPISKSLLKIRQEGAMFRIIIRLSVNDRIVY